MKIEELDLSVRAYNCLKRGRIDTVEQLQQMSDDDLLRIRNMGTRTVEEIREKVVYINTMTNADKIRAMSDEDLTNIIYDLNMEGTFCTNRKECEELLNNDKLTDEMCKKCLLEWLRKPVEETKIPSGMFLDKQESGLTEEE